MELINETVSRFSAITASDAPAPGGGSISALAGALAAALGQMVARLTVGRKKYQAVEAELAPWIPVLEEHQAALLAAVDADSSAFNRYMEALAMPKDTPEQQAARREAMQEGLKSAAQVPLEVAERVVLLFPALEAMVTKGNPNSVTDGMVGTMMARTAVLGAVFNVRVNLRSISDEAFCQAMSRRCAEAQSTALRQEARILSTVDFSGF